MPATRENMQKATGDEARRIRNRIMRSKYKTSMKKVKSYIDSNEIQLAIQEARNATSEIDKAVKKKVIHANKGANLKSQIDKLVSSNTVKQEVPDAIIEEGEKE
jgi:small subunit ribosomal protein S20